MTALNITLQAPVSLFGGQYLAQDGTSYTIGPSGVLVLPAIGQNITTAINAGFVVASDFSPVTDGLTALAGGGQTGATQTFIGINRVATVATAGDSVLLPASAPGSEITVINDAALAMQVYGKGSDTINGIAAATGFSQPGKSTSVYRCATAGLWIVGAGTGTLPPAKFTLNATSGATTTAAGDMTGADYVCLGLSAVGAATYTTRTAALMFADQPNAKVGDSIMLLITNTSGGTTTIGAGVGVTITGTATLATNTTRLFNVKFVSATAVTIQSVAVGTIS